MRPTPCSRRTFLAGAAGLLASSNTLASGDDREGPTFRFKKTGAVVLDRGAPGAFDATHAKYPCVLKVGDEWMMWYNGRADNAFTGAIGLATSRDGLKWAKQNEGRPVLAPGGPGSADETKADHPAVLHFDDRFHMWYTAGPRDSRYQICYATSDDGHRWRRENAGQPVLGPGEKGRFDDQVVLHPAAVRDPTGLLHLWYNGVGPQKDFRVGHATSRDGVHWERQNGGDPVLTPGKVSGQEEVYVYNVMVLLEEGIYRMWYSSALELTPQGAFAPHGNGIVYAESRDGTHWRRDDVVTLRSGDAGSPDAYACFAPYVVRRGDTLWMYYSMGSTYQRYTTGLAKQQ